MSRPDVLVVGAGAVGQAYALALQRAGTAVHFFVKPHHEDRLAAGMPIRERGLFADGPLHDLSGCPRLTDWDTVAARSWHSVWLAVDSTALQGAWVEALGNALGAATVVLFQTGASSRAHVLAHLPAAQTVSAMIPFLSWWAPLSPGDPVPDGPQMCVWHPPLMSTPLSGPLDRVLDIKALLEAGGLGTRITPNAAAQGALGSAVLLPTIAGLEVVDWRLDGLRRRSTLKGVLAAIHEARAIAGRIHGVPVGTGALLRPLLFQVVAWLAPRVAPLDLETYLRVHFTKVGAQTRASLAALVETGRTAGQSTTALARLHDALRARPDR